MRIFSFFKIISLGFVFFISGVAAFAQTMDEGPFFVYENLKTEDEYQAILADDPNNHQAKLEYSQLMMSKGQFSTAERELEELLEMADTNNDRFLTDVRRELIFSRIMLDKFEEAKDVYDLIYPPSGYGDGIDYSQMANRFGYDVPYAQLLKITKKAYDLDPENGYLSYVYGFVLSMSDPEAAVGILEQTMEKYDPITTSLLLTELYIKLEDHEKTINALTIIMDAHPAYSVEQLAKLGRTLRDNRIGRDIGFDIINRFFSLWAERDPGNKEIYMSLIGVGVYYGEIDSVRNITDKATKTDKTNEYSYLAAYLGSLVRLDYHQEFLTEFARLAEEFSFDDEIIENYLHHVFKYAFTPGIDEEVRQVYVAELPVFFEKMTALFPENKDIEFVKSEFNRKYGNN